MYRDISYKKTVRVRPKKLSVTARKLLNLLINLDMSNATAYHLEQVK